MSGARVLAIDDSLTIRKLLETVLGRAGYVLDLAASGGEGLELARRHAPDLILLDYVLPDMKGLDVCQGLARDAALRHVPVVIMSARGSGLRELFKDIGAVVGLLPKPFTAGEVAFTVPDALRGARGARPGTPAPAPSGPAFTPAQKEAAARALYARLKERFERMPQWFAGLGEAAAGPYFARKLLTPDAMDAILSALGPVYEEVLGAGRGAAGEPAEVGLEGHTGVLPLTVLLTELLALQRTGALLLEQPLRTTTLYLRRGEVVLITHNRPEEYLRNGPVDVRALPEGSLSELLRELRRSGRPVYVGLVEAGLLAPGELAGALHAQGRRALVEAANAGPGRFEWRDTRSLPDWVESHGRAHSLDQLRLERLREVDDWTQVELHVGSLDLVFRRAEAFSARIQRLEPNENERRVLTVINGRHTVQQVIERTGLPTFEVFHVLFRLSQMELVRRLTPAAAAGPGDARPVLLADGDQAGVHEPLARLLRTRLRPLPLMSLPGGADLLASVAQERPRMLIVNTATPALDLLGAARQLRATLETSDVLLVAVQERAEAVQAEELRLAGFDAVLAKPFLFADLERLLGA